MTWGVRLTAAAGVSFLVTLLGALATLRVKNLAFLRDESDGRPIGGPALGLGIGLGLVLGGDAINPLILGGVGAVFLLGLLDDLLDLSPWRKLLGQSIAAVMGTIGLGAVHALSIAGISGSVGIGGSIISFFWLLSLTNGVNLIDGLDGLAIGVTAPSAIGLLIISGITENPTGALLSAITVAGLLGFYPVNRFRARLLLGDTGAELIGYLLAATALQVLTFGERAFPILPGLFFLFLPIADTAFAVLRRIYHHRAVFRGDRKHIHHRLKKRIGERQAVLMLSLVSIVSTGIGLICWSMGI